MMIPGMDKLGAAMAAQAKPENLRAGGSLATLDAQGNPRIAITAPILGEGKRMNTDGQVEAIPGYLESQSSILKNAEQAKAGNTLPQPRVDATGAQYTPPGTLQDQINASKAALQQRGPTPQDMASMQAADAAGKGFKWDAQGGMQYPGSGQTTLGPTKQSELTGRGTQLAEVEQGIHSAAANAVQNDARIGEMQKVIPLIPFGAMAPTRLNLARYASEVPGIGGALANMAIPDAANAVPAMQVFNKSATNMVIEQSKQLGTREAASVIQMVAGANPNISWSRPAAETIMQYLEGSNKWAIDRSNEIPKWKAEHGGSIEGFQEYWNANHPQSDYIPPMDKIRLAITTGDIAPPKKGEQKPSQDTPASLSQTTTALYKARQAIKGGADREAVRQRMIQQGFSPEGL